MPYVYIVECADGSLYTGWALDVEQRVKVHNAGRGARYTRLHGPVRLVYAEEQPDRSRGDEARTGNQALAAREETEIDH